MGGGEGQVGVGRGGRCCKICTAVIFFFSRFSCSCCVIYSALYSFSYFLFANPHMLVLCCPSGIVFFVTLVSHLYVQGMFR